MDKPAEVWEYVGISPERFEKHAARASQQTSSSCWAACMRMILSFKGEEMSEKALLDLLPSGTKGATSENYIKAWTALGLKPQIIEPGKGKLTETDLMKPLKKAMPAIASVDEGFADWTHATVLIGLRNRISPFTGNQVTLYDPDPLKASDEAEKIVLSWRDFKEKAFRLIYFEW